MSDTQGSPGASRGAASEGETAATREAAPSAPPHASRRTFAERSIAAAYRARSLEARAGGILSVGLVCVLGAGLLAWYYGAALKRPARAAAAARAVAARRAQGDMPLPPLPALAELESRYAAAVRDERDSAGRVEARQMIRSPLERPAQLKAAAGVPAQPLPPWLAELPAAASTRRPFPWVPVGAGDVPLLWTSVARAPVSTALAAPDPRRRTLDRRLSGPVFERQTGSPGGNASSAQIPTPSSRPEQVPGATGPGAAFPAEAGAASARPGQLAQLLTPAMTPAVAARVLPTRTLLLPKGAFIDCTLETAIDSTLPGMTTCITATDTFGADGKVVLLERGSKLVGETRGEVRQGSARVFVLWTEARTPTGVVIPLASPGTDELGRSGLPGQVNRHFFERFGAALLISIIDTGGEIAAQGGNGTIIYSPEASQDVMSEVLRDTVRIPPTVIKHQGDRIQVLVARDIDFRSVYELRAATRRP